MQENARHTTSPACSACKAGFTCRRKPARSLRYPPAHRPVHALEAPTHSAYPGSCADTFTVSPRSVLHTWMQENARHTASLACSACKRVSRVVGNRRALCDIPPALRPVHALEAPTHSAYPGSCADTFTVSPRSVLHMRTQENARLISRPPTPFTGGFTCRWEIGLCSIAQPAIPRADGFTALKRSRRRISKAMRKAQRSGACGMFYIPSSGQAVRRRLYARPESFRERIGNSPGAISSRHNAAPLSQAAFASESRWAVPFARANFLCG